MTKEQYLAQRKNLVDAAQDYITGGKLEDAAVKTKEIETLDSNFEAEAKAQANLNALRDNNKIVDLAAAGAGRVIDSTIVTAQAETKICWTPSNTAKRSWQMS